jgi:hypothetical protein
MWKCDYKKRTNKTVEVYSVDITRPFHGINYRQRDGVHGTHQVTYTGANCCAHYTQ